MNKKISTVAVLVMALISLMLVSCGYIEDMPLIKTEEKPEFKILDCEVGVATPLLKMAVLHPPLTFNPVTALDDVSRLISAQLTATLYRYEPVKNEFEPWLATGYDRDGESKVFTIHLRRNIVFSDERAFTADDVIETLNYILQTTQVQSPLKVYLQFGSGTLGYTKIDDHTLQFTLPESLSAIEPILARIPVLPHELIQDARGQNRLSSLYELRSPPEELPSIGPFMIQRYAPDENRLLLERNPNFWAVDPAGQTLPYAREVVINFANTTTEISMKFRTGETDIIDFISPEDSDRLANVRGLNIHDVGPSSSTVVAWFNQSRRTDPQTDQPNIERWQYNLFAEQTFRDAVSGIIDRGAIVSELYLGRAIPAGTIVSPQEFRWYRDMPIPQASAGAALQQLRDLNYSYNRGGGSPATYGRNNDQVIFSIAVLSGDDIAEKVANRLETDLADLGIRATVLALPYEFFYKDLYAPRPNYQMVVMTLRDPQHPFFMREIMHSSSIRHFWYTLQEVAETDTERAINMSLDQMFLQGTPSSKFEAAQQIQQLLNQGKFMLPLVKPNGIFGAKGKIRNIRLSHRCSTLCWNLEEIFALEE
jgi:peptide/nickel transport system substrate-binding protein